VKVIPFAIASSISISMFLAFGSSFTIGSSIYSISSI
jgi:hypothetical protein